MFYLDICLKYGFLIFSFVVWLILCRESQCIILSLNILRTLVRLNAGGTHPGTIMTTSTHSTSPSCCAAMKLCWLIMPLCMTTSWRQVRGPSGDNFSASHCNSFCWCWGVYFLLLWSRSSGDAGGVVVTDNRYEAYCPDEHMWLAASCRDTPSHCILYVTAGAGWGIEQILQRASAYNLPVAFGVAAWGDFVEIPKTFKSFLARFFGTQLWSLEKIPNLTNRYCVWWFLNRERRFLLLVDTWRRVLGSQPNEIEVPCTCGIWMESRNLHHWLPGFESWLELQRTLFLTNPNYTATIRKRLQFTSSPYGSWTARPTPISSRNPRWYLTLKTYNMLWLVKGIISL